jgi:hypothetical protein
MKKDSVEDAAFILYIIPILLNGGYGLWCWVSKGADLAALQQVYLQLTREPVIFLVGLLAVCIAVVLDARYLSLIEVVDRRVTRLAVFCFITALATALLSTRFNIGNGLTLFLQGRYALIFPVLLMVLTFLFRVREVSSASFKSAGRWLSLLLLLVSPLTLYLLWRLGVVWYAVFAVPLILVIASVALMMRG